MTRPVHASVDEMLSRVDERRPLESVGKSGARLERVRIGEDWYVVKHGPFVAEAGEDARSHPFAVQTDLPRSYLGLWRSGVS